MDTAIMTNPWIPSKVVLDRELPVMMLEAPFVSMKQENDYTADEKHECLDIDGRMEFNDVAADSSTVDKGGKFINKSSSLVPPMRINYRVQIDVVDISEEGQNKYILIYEEQCTKLVILKALKSMEPAEVANEVADIVATVGAPQIIESGNGRDYAEQVVREICLSLPDFDVVHGDSTQHGQDRRDFKLILKSWVTDNPGRNFKDALRIVQVAENTKPILPHGKAPSQLFFGRNICEDLRRMIGMEESEGHDSIPESIIKSRENKVSSDERKKSGFRIEMDVESSTMKKLKKSSIAEADLEKIVASQDKVSNDTENCFSCEVCGKRYIKLGHLRNHTKTHTRTKTLPCDLCPKAFDSASLYDKHKQRFHGNEKNGRTDKEADELEDRLMEKKNRPNFVEGEKKLATSYEFERHLTNRNGRTKMSLRSLDKGSLDELKSWSNGNNSCDAKVTNDYLLKCTYCVQTFNFRSVLERHMRCHTNERPYGCELCDKTFKQLGHLSQHILTHMDYRTFRCAICSSKFDTFESLKLHAASHDDGMTKGSYRLFECDMCKKIFTAKSVMARHMYTHTHERKFSCKICNKRFKQACHVKSHMLVHTGERKFPCGVCDKRFSMPNSLKKHMYVHTGEKPHHCDICGSGFLEKRNLTSHVMTHTNAKPFSCKICGNRYALVDTLRRHMRASHERGRIYQCEICAKMFKQLAHLSVHKKVHNDERPFQCHLCEKNFKHKNVMKAHLAIHTNVRAFECDVCKATFIRKTNLQTHISSAHLNERPYVCDICDKRFKQISHLNGHLIVHSNSMPYQCDYCDLRCNRLDNLKKHMRLHTPITE